MIRAFFLGAVLGTATLALAACGDDEKDGDDGGNGTGGGANVECTPGGGGACQNEMDCPKVESGEARTTAQTCGVGCLQDTDPGACTVQCIVDGDLSMGCAVCYATLAGCARENCLNECGSNAASAECNQCQIDSGCRAGFDACSGLETAN
jgi:hypothetical protein